MALTFYYQARTPEGNLISGSMQAEKDEDVVAHLRTRALFITSIAQSTSLSGHLASVRALGPVSPPPLLTFFRSFATLMRSGISLSRSLRVTIAQCPDARLREALQAVLAEIEQGRSLSAAMHQRPHEFAPLYIAMVEAGEAGGMLDDVIERVACMLEKDQAFRKKIGAACAYPLIVFCAAITLIFFLLSTLVPTFGRLFEQLHVDIPPNTRLLLYLANFVREPIFYGSILVIITAALAIILLARRDIVFASVLDNARLKIPLFGTMHRKLVIARIARTLGGLLHSGVDVLHSVEVVAPVSGNLIYAKSLHDLHAALREGDSITAQLERSKIFDPMVLQMVRVGEETGTLDAMLIKIADYYESDVESLAATLGTILEPVLILFVGAVVGFIVFSVFVPMYSLVSHIQ